MSWWRSLSGVFWVCFWMSPNLLGLAGRKMKIIGTKPYIMKSTLQDRQMPLGGIICDIFNNLTYGGATLDTHSYLDPMRVLIQRSEYYQMM